MMLKGFKGFDKNMQCKGFQYHVGGEYEEPDAVLCVKGFHFCEFPFDVFKHYPPANSRYAVVEGAGNMFKNDFDSKVVCTKLRIEKEITLSELVSAGIKRTESDMAAARNIACWSTTTNTQRYSMAQNTGEHSVAVSTGETSVAASIFGDYSAVANTGDYSVATNIGDSSVAMNTGEFSIATNAGRCSVAASTGPQAVTENAGKLSVAASTGLLSVARNAGRHSVAVSTGERAFSVVEGRKAVAVAVGRESRAKGSVGCWLVLAEWDDKSIVSVRSVQVDGDKIKADTFYCLKEGIFVECDR